MAVELKKHCSNILNQQEVGRHLLTPPDGAVMHQSTPGATAQRMHLRIPHPEIHRAAHDTQDDTGIRLMEKTCHHRTCQLSPNTLVGGSQRAHLVAAQ
jgi:hypothetical protein